MLVAVLFVGAVAVNATPAAAADCTIVSTLRVGSVGAEVSCLQASLGVSADGKFGPMTAAAVKAWQASKGLAADGVFGAMSRAAMSGSTTVLPAGCQAGWLVNPMTGASCTGGSTSGGALEGGAGDLNGADVLSTYSGEEVLEGDEDVKVLAIELEADNGSDLKISSLKLGFANTELTAGSSKKMDSVIDEVKVWMGSDEVGSASSDDFSESDDVYTKSISLSDAVVKAGDKEKLYVTVSSVSNVDSDDLANDWTVAVESVRFEDAEGVVTTDSSTGDLGTENYTNNTAEAAEKLFSFEDLSSSGDVELKVSKGSASPEATAVSVDDTSDTNNVVLLEAKLKAEGTDMTVDNIEFDVTPTGANANVIVKEYKLLLDGEEIDSIAAGSIADGVTGTIEFTNLEDDFMIDLGDTAVIQVVADINDLEATFGNGDSILVSFANASNVDDTTNTVVEDENGDTVVAADRSGSAVGETQTFYSDGMQVSLVSVDADVTADADPATAGSDSTGTFVIKFKVTAFGDDIYVDKDAVEDTTPFNTATQLAYSVTNTGTTAAAVAVLQSTADLQTDSYLVEEGTSETFTLTVALTSATDTFSRIKLESIGYKVGSDAAGDTQYTADLDNFKTADLFLNTI